jgi:hypothetical protein
MTRRGPARECGQGFFFFLSHGGVSVLARRRPEAALPRVRSGSSKLKISAAQRLALETLVKKTVLCVLLTTCCSQPAVYGSPGASLEVILRGTDTCETAAFEPGARLFTDRPYTVAEVPADLKGLPFLRAGIDGVRVRCTEAGLLTALTPPEVPHATSLAASLRSYGFERVPQPASFQLFGTNAHERVNVYRKQLAAGETLRLGKWCTLVGFQRATGKVVAKKPWPQNDGERLYNGIVPPAAWPPEDIDTRSEEPMPVPYLDHPPAVIAIDTSRPWTSTRARTRRCRSASSPTPTALSPTGKPGILDDAGMLIKPFTLANCIPVAKRLRPDAVGWQGRAVPLHGAPRQPLCLLDQP